MAQNDKKKIRAEFRKNRTVRARRTDWTRAFDAHGFEEEAPVQGERVSGKGDLTRRRTICGLELASGEQSAFDVRLDVDESACRRGRVLAVFGLTSEVQGDDGVLYQCATRRLLKTLSTEQRHVVAAGDRVSFRTVPHSQPPEGLIERVEPRHGTISRTVRGRQQVLVANVDQLLVISSAAEPRLKPNLIDRLLVTAEKGRVRPVICINKIDLVDIASLEPLVGVYSRMGYQVLLLSARTGFGIERFARLIAGRESVLAGQSGVGKSSLLNAVDLALELRVAAVSEETEKGRHTTTTARLLAAGCGGYVVDTPGIRQFQLWDVIPEEIMGFCRDLRPYASLCRFPDCTHTHEDGCVLKDAVADGRLDERRYESYCQMIEQ
ncbi:MAG: ribosome small subunit-dependent GTPase A [Thermoguttaceae bacterium]|jgi:ribosome biogenesis GTPase